MILTGPEILKQVRAGEIRIDPFNEELLNPGSIDVRLGSRFFVYDAHDTHEPLDASKENPGKEEWRAPGDRVLLQPGMLYLAHTLERIWSRSRVPVIDGKSSLGRLGVSVHQTAGYGDAGFDGQYTLEVTVVYPIWVAVGMRFAQMRFHQVVGDVVPYAGKYVGRAAEGPVPAIAKPAALPSNPIDPPKFPDKVNGSRPLG